MPINLREELKSPLGLLIPGEPETTIKILTNYIKMIRPPLFASVGDFVSENVLNNKLIPDIVVIDNRTLRKEIKPIKINNMERVFVKNPPASITEEAWNILRDSITLKRKLAIIVEGEEDLLVLPLMAEMPLGSVIIYGQPYEGLVVITVTEERRSWARSFLNKMEKNKNET